MKPYFLHDWAPAVVKARDVSWRRPQGYQIPEDPEEAVRDAIASDFQIHFRELDLYDILLASYTSETYSGDAFLVLRRKLTGELLLVEASHCSCYGLEGQWNPEPTTVEALETHLKHHYRAVEYRRGLELVIAALVIAALRSEVQA